MLKVLLVDDEPNVRHGVKMMIPWEKLGLEVVGEAEDGDDGLGKILSLEPDIVIADVKMPGMSGIKMIEAAKNKGFNGKSLILSGYSDFTYAKEAMSLGVKGFILKPLDEDELIEALKSVSEEIRLENRDKDAMRKGSEYMNEQFVRALLLGDDSAIGSAALGEYRYDSYDAAIISPSEDMEQEEKTLLIDSVKKRLAACENVDAVAPELSSGIMAVLFKGWKKEKILSFFEELNKDLFGKIFVAIGNTVTSPEDIRQSYLDADGLLKNRFMYLHCGVVTPSTMSDYDGGEDKISETVGHIYSYIEINDTERLGESLDNLQRALCGSSFTPERIKVLCITAVMEIKSRLVQNIGDKKTEQFINDEFIAKIGERSSLFDIIELLKKNFTELSHTYFGRTTKSTMERVVQYIRSNYSRELRLEQLANIFGYNSAYLGKVFHQYTGENFNNYLDRIIITEQKRLLAMEEYKVYEVAEMVGYSNINYFHNKFKKYVGVSPLSYKRQSKEDGSEKDGE